MPRPEHYRFAEMQMVHKRDDALGDAIDLAINSSHLYNRYGFLRRLIKRNEYKKLEGIMNISAKYADGLATEAETIKMLSGLSYSLIGVKQRSGEETLEMIDGKFGECQVDLKILHPQRLIEGEFGELKSSADPEKVNGVYVELSPLLREREKLAYEANLSIDFSERMGEK